MGGRIQFGILNKANTQIPYVKGTKKMSAEKDKKISELYEEVLTEGLRTIENQSTLEDHEVKVE